MLTDLTGFPDDYRDENRGFVWEYDIYFYSCRNHIVFHFHGMSTSALHFGDLSWKINVSVCWCPTQQLHTVYSELPTRELLRLFYRVDLLHKSITKTIINSWNTTWENNQMLFKMSHGVFPVDIKETWLCMSSTTILRSVFKVIMFEFRIWNICLFQLTSIT